VAAGPTVFLLEGSGLRLLEVRLELHGLFWFHTFAQPRDKYTHIMLPVVHNYPLTLALLGLPGEAYASVSGVKTFSYKPEDIWERHGFYVYPALVEKAVSRILTFSMGGTGYVQLKPQTRASVPDYTAIQLFLPGTRLRTFILAKAGYSPPRFIRMGAKRYGVFRVYAKSRGRARVDEQRGRAITHPFNARDTGSSSYQAVLRHYAGPIAIGGAVDRVVVAGDVVLALPQFIEGREP